MKIEDRIDRLEKVVVALGFLHRFYCGDWFRRAGLRADHPDGCIRTCKECSGAEWEKLFPLKES